MVDSTAKIQGFWDWFSVNELKLYNTLFDNTKFNANSPQSTPMLDKLSNRLHRANKALTYEFFLNRDEEFKFEFYISPNGNTEAFQFLIELVKAAPPSKQFIVYPFKQAHKNIEELQTMGLAYGKQKIKIKDIYFKYKEQPFSKISLDLFFKGYDGNYIQAMELMYYLLDKVIGEYYVSTMIGEIGVHNLNSKLELSPLFKLPDTISLYKEKYKVPTIEELLN